MKPTDAQVKVFWEGYGFTLEELHPLPSKEPYFVLHEPDGEQWDYWIGEEWDTEIPVRELYPPIDLNSLFKYAVPKLENYKRGFVISWAGRTTWVVKLHSYDAVGDTIKSVDNDPALALFWALDKVREASK